MIVTRKMDKILSYGEDTVTVQAGALYIDVNQELAKRGKQFYVNVELGNLTIGSACCGGTKDASMPGEFGQIASYAVGIKMVLPNGDLFEVDESDPELLQLARSSYGLFGIVYEATFRVRKLAAMEVHHEKFSLDEFAAPAARAARRDESMMLYINPFKDTITVEFRRYHEASSAGASATVAVEAAQRGVEPLRPAVGAQRQPAVPLEVDPLGADRLLQRADRARADQGDQGQAPRCRSRSRSATRRSPATTATCSASGRSPRSSYIDACAPTSSFSKEHYERTGYRLDLLSVGYRILADQSSLFSYSFNGTSSPSTRSPPAPSAGTPSCASTTRCAATSAARRCSTRPTC